MEAEFKRTFESLEGIFDLAERFFREAKVEREYLFSVNLALEELFTNMVKYNHGSREILVSLSLTDGVLKICLTDFDVDPFDVTHAPAAKIDGPIEDRKTYGLGLHLTRSFMDGMEYQYIDRQSTVTVFKNIGNREP